MTWVKIDDGFADHPKVVEAGPLAAWLYVCGLTYCSRQLTDGFIPTGQVRRLADLDGVPALVDTLMSVGLWEKTDGGYQVHDYLDYNPSREDVLKKRGEAAERMRKVRSRELPANSERTSPIRSREVHQPRPVPVPSRPVPQPNPIEENDILSVSPTIETEKPKVITEAERTFNEFWKLYPGVKGSKAEAAAVWMRMNTEQRRAALEMIPQFAACAEWKRDNYKFVRHAVRWLKYKGWEDEVPVYIPASNGKHGSSASDLMRLADAVEARERGVL